MRRYHYPDQEEIIADINVIPLVDISLVLLIIFMVTANYLTAYLNVKLPEAKSAQDSAGGNGPTVATVTVTQEGPVYLENKLVTMGELKSQLKERFASNPKLAVILNVDKRANFGSAVTVLDLLQAIGIKNTDISTLEAE
ncbi:MAG: biopolymer transporter ExbD [Candidatus Omnitrophica bacterium]|nr:biopolymer transporter ExbD [Candidatus Omnitrophota bacterium]